MILVNNKKIENYYVKKINKKYDRFSEKRNKGKWYKGIKNENENIRCDFKNQNIKNYNSKILHEHDNMKMIT